MIQTLVWGWSQNNVKVEGQSLRETERDRECACMHDSWNMSAWRVKVQADYHRKDTWDIIYWWDKNKNDELGFTRLTKSLVSKWNVENVIFEKWGARDKISLFIFGRNILLQVLSDIQI